MLKQIGAIALSLWILLLSTGFTVYQRECLTKGDRELSFVQDLQCDIPASPSEKDKHKKCCYHKKQTPKESDVTIEALCCVHHEIQVHITVESEDNTAFFVTGNKYVEPVSNHIVQTSLKLYDGFKTYGSDPPDPLPRDVRLAQLQTFLV